MPLDLRSPVLPGWSSSCRTAEPKGRTSYLSSPRSRSSHRCPRSRCRVHRTIGIRITAISPLSQRISPRSCWLRPRRHPALHELSGLNLPGLHRLPLPSSVPIPPNLPLPPRLHLPADRSGNAGRGLESVQSVSIRRREHDRRLDHPHRGAITPQHTLDDANAFQPARIRPGKREFSWPTSVPGRARPRPRHWCRRSRRRRRWLRGARCPWLRRDRRDAASGRRWAYRRRR